MKDDKRYWLSIPPWIIVGAVIILVPIFVFWTFENIHKQKKNTALLLSKKGAALIRSFEAGARTGMMGMHTSDFNLQRLLTETALQPDVIYLIVTDIQGTILAHNDPAKIEKGYSMKRKNSILVVDDDPAHRTMLLTLLTGWGYQITEADDGAAAIEKVHDQAFDLILMDIRMIKVSGLQALSEIKVFNPAIPLLL